MSHSECINTHYDLDIAVIRGEPEEVAIQLIESDAIQTGDKLVPDIQNRENTHMSVQNVPTKSAPVVSS